jgi:fibronectin-binding autotransporter adhesin
MRRHSWGKSIGLRCAAVGRSVRRTMSSGALSRGALVAVAGLSLACGGALVSPAQAQTWNGGSGNWGTAGSWTPATVPNALGATATFNAPPSGTNFGVSLSGGPFTIGTLNLDGPADGSGYFFQNGTLIMQATSGQATINVQTNLSTNNDFGEGGTPATLQLNSTTNINIGSSATIGFAAQSTIAGSGGLIFSGSGTATLAGASTYTGSTTIDTGSTMRGGAANAFSAASATTVNGTLDLGGFGQTVSSLSGSGIVTNASASPATLTNQGASSTFSGIIENGFEGPATSLTQNSAGNTLTLTGANIYGGATTISAGTLQLGNGGTSGSIIGDVADNGTLAFDRSDAVTFPGAIFGAGGVAQIGTGATTLTAANTYTGQTNVTAGTLSVTGSIGSAATPTGAISIASAGVLNVGASGAVTASALNNAGNLVNNGTLSAPTITNAGTLTTTATITASTSLTNSGTMDAAGSINTPELNNAGTFTLTNSLGGIGAFSNSGVLNLNGQILTASSVNTLGGSIAGGGLTGAINAAGGTISAALTGATTTVEATSGTTTLSAANSFGGGTTIRAAELVAAHVTGGMIDALGTGPITLNGGIAGATLESAVTGTLSPAITINPGSAATIGATSGNTLTLASPLSFSGGAGALHFGSATDLGTVALAPVSLLSVPASGQISVDAGTLVLANSNAQALLGGVSNVSVAGTLDLNSLPNPTTVRSLTLAGGTIVDGSLNVNGPISSSGGTLSGIGGTASLTTFAGTTMLQGNNSYAGMTTVNGGVLDVVGA